METICVIGAGIMGQGLSMNLSYAGYNVALIDNCEENISKAEERMKNDFRLYQLLNSELKEHKISTVMERITLSNDLSSLENSKFIFECISEKLDEKIELYKKLSNIIDDKCIIATNTSVIPIDYFSKLIKFPGNVIGTHLMNPVPLKNMVEVIKGSNTSDQTLLKTKDLLSKIGKEFIVVNDSPGFVINRVFMLTVNEAILLLQENVAPKDDIDNLFKSCLGFKMGPLETADLIGLDTILYSLENLYEITNDEKFIPAKLLVEKVGKGNLGKKCGEGFYNYNLFSN